ncbi:cupin domain-containing protein [Altererythrobacter sp. Root672]|uniref:cupin domain-containing protein n=1 Tax=Altererythrobacter sp. Root672 TaxID=1736584 RepID=UPI0006F77F3B|nr:cupin domain-containing protein [Altererythrobacter sp. Root672]KRA81445.1 cupin [Altererythrobacter sp. Root672]
MRLSWIIAATVYAASLPFAYAQAQQESSATRPPRGSNEVLRSPISGIPGVEVIVSDVVIPPNAQVARHYHPGEEFLYLIEGTATHVEEGKPDLPLKVGDTYVIPPRAIHAPKGGPEGARAIVFRVHTAGQPERIEAPGPQ